MRLSSTTRAVSVTRRMPVVTLLAALALLTLVAAGWWLSLQHSATRHASTFAPGGTAERLADSGGSFGITGDSPMEPWRMDAPAPSPDPAATSRVDSRPRPEPVTDWSALRADVALASPVLASAPQAAPTELAVAIPAGERQRLIAGAREPDSPPGPLGYRPGIAVIVPGGSQSGGVCR